MSTTGFIDGMRAEVRNLPAYNAGLSSDLVRAQYGVTHVAKLGSNENPRGASAAVLAHLAQWTTAASLSLYPDPSCSVLRTMIAEKLNVAPEQLLFGNGSEDLLAIAAHTFLGAGDEVVTVVPSFGLHIIYPQSAGAKVITVPMRADLEFDVDALIAAISPQTRMVIISNPSNPVGCAMNANEMRRLLSAVSPNTLVLWDEAYFEYAAGEHGYPDSLAILRESGLPWLLLRTFSKAYGLAGLRVGYGVASAPELARLDGPRSHALQHQSDCAGSRGRCVRGSGSCCRERRRHACRANANACCARSARHQSGALAWQLSLFRLR